MKKIEIELTGKTPLLMHSPKAMLEAAEGITSAPGKKQEYKDVKKEAEKVCYRTKDGYLYLPSTAIIGAMINASAYKKEGKYALRPFIAGGCRIPEDELILTDKKGKKLKNYEIDLRTVVIQRSRVVRARPKLPNWVLKFTLLYNEDMLPTTEPIEIVLREAGDRVGLLDFSPRNQGSFGTYEVTKFKKVK